jgi:hypothetical protein
MKNILTRKVLFAMLIIASVLLCTILAFIIIWRPAAGRPSLTPASVALIVIPASTSTPLTLPPTETSYPPTPVFTSTPAPGQIAVGVYVQPSTGGVGLRVHIAPSLSADLAFPGAAFDSEVFLVTDGPKQADGYTWWYLTASYDATRAGWAVQNYLVAIPTSH